MTTTPMPPLTGNMVKNGDYYRLEWMPDGYPGRRDESTVWAHPIYGAYALKDYLSQYQRRPSAELHTALTSVARAAVARMESFEDALVFWYEKDVTHARFTHRGYSGLTQAYYALNLARTARVLNDPTLRSASDRVFRSLLITTDRGGVLAEGRRGPSVAEFPQEPNSYILNGWLSALCAIDEYADVAGSSAARDLVRASAVEVTERLPQYDVPALCTSRYGLSGFVYCRMVFRQLDGRRVQVINPRLVIPGEPDVRIEEVGGPRWVSHAVEADVKAARSELIEVYDNQLRLNVVMSRASYPQPNRLKCQLSGPATTVEVQMQTGRYDPLTVASVDRTWVTIARLECSQGNSKLDVALPWDVADLVAYPTNFAKRIDSRNVNIYHQVHINRLRELHGLVRLPELAEWADTWSRYLSQWKDLPVYAGLHARGPEGLVPVADLVGKVLIRTV